MIIIIIIIIIIVKELNSKSEWARGDWSKVGRRAGL